MKQWMIAAALGAATLAVPAAAGPSSEFQHDLETAFNTRGDCQSALRWADYDYKTWFTRVLGEDGGDYQKELHATFECQKKGSKWYIVMVTE